MSSPPSQPPPPPPHRLPTIMGTPVFDIDLTGETDTNDLPFWLRDVIDRVFSATGIANPSRKQSASDDAIDSLVEVKDDRVINERCPICFEDYVMHGKVKSYDERSTFARTNPTLSDKFRRTHQQNLDITGDLHDNGVRNIQSLDRGRKFRDPSMFFPADTSGSIPFRFPVSSLNTLEPVTDDDLFPTYAEDKNRQQDSASKRQNEDSHVPVKMPNCYHVFGRSCITEWLKGNVTCPLCRKDVEADTPQKRKERRVRSQITSNFNDDNLMLQHIISHSSDVFRPFRRASEGPQITPLTDSYMPQNWASPTYPARNEYRTATPDPGLYMPRRFPMSELGASHQRRTPMTQVRYGTVNINGNNSSDINNNNTTRNTRSSSTAEHTTVDDNNTIDEEISNNGNPGSNNITTNRGDGHVSSSSDEVESTSLSRHDNRVSSNFSTPPVLSTTASSSFVGGTTPATIASLINRDSDMNSPGSSGSSGGSGGPERSRRNGTNPTGRSHPYTRPSPGSNE